MASQWEDKNIRCPFYRKGDRERHRITCEGLGDAMTLTWNFANERQRTMQLHVFCQSGYQNCELYRAILDALPDD